MKETLKEALINSSIKVLGKLYTAKGKTILEAITNLKPEIARGAAVLALEKNGVRKEKILLPRLVANVYGKVSRLSKEIAIKQVTALFDANAFGS